MMLSMRWATAIIIFAVATSALSLFAGRNFETSILLAALIAILGFLTIAVLLLAEIVDAVHALSRARSAVPPNAGVRQPDGGVMVAPHAGHLRVVIAAIESVRGSRASEDAIEVGNSAVKSRCKFPSIDAVGNYVDVVIPSDRHK